LAATFFVGSTGFRYSTVKSTPGAFLLPKHLREEKHPTNILLYGAPPIEEKSLDEYYGTIDLEKVSDRVVKEDEAGGGSDTERDSAIAAVHNEERRPTKLQADDWTPDQPLLEVKGLHVQTTESKEPILRGVSLKVYQGTTHAVMGRNGSGKSTLGKVIAGHPAYEIVKGTIKYKGMDVSKMRVEERAVAGIFLAFQYPVELPGIANMMFLREAVNEKRKALGEEEVSAMAFEEWMLREMRTVNLGTEFLERPVNYGYSGREKKRNEILQMLMLNPILSILDETDSGLDVDSFKITVDAISQFKDKDPCRTLMVVTHYKKLLDMIPPDVTHVLHKGRVIHTGGPEVPELLEKDGFQPFLSEYKRRVAEKKILAAAGTNMGKLHSEDSVG